MAPILERLVAVLAAAGEPDDRLQAAISQLASEEGVDWVGVAFLEDGELHLGPTAGRPDEKRRAHLQISYRGTAVGELRVDGAVPRDVLEQIAYALADHVLIGWDTQGETWDP
jgi:hypothetical protein